MNMTPEEMNTQLYEKLTAEQAKYRDWLMGQPPEEILNHAYEYAVREDILAAAELMDMPQAQAAALLAVPTEAALLRPDPSPWLDRRCWSYISDGWSLAMYLARRIGWDGEAFWERFQLARRDLLTDGVGPQPDPVLAGRLLRLRDRGIRLVLCSNSRREGGEALLARLGLLGCFDEQIFDAEKPHATPKRMEGWSARWGIPSDAMLFVGDQGYGDLYAGLRAGARTLRVSPYPADDEGLWDGCIRTQEELKELLAAWC